MASLLRSRTAGLHLGLMLALTFSTGVIDAVGYLGLDRVFTGNMTGNVVILGMALTGADGLPIVGPVVALLCFIAGAFVAGITLRRLAAGWFMRTTVLLAGVTVLLALAAVLVSAVGTPIALLVTGMLGAAMGAQAGAARHIAVKDVTTVVVTSTLVGFAFDLGGTAGNVWVRRVLAIVLIAGGAGVGALLLRVHVGLGIGLAALIVAVVTVLGHLGRPAGEA